MILDPYGWRRQLSSLTCSAVYGGADDQQAEAVAADSTDPVETSAKDILELTKLRLNEKSGFQQLTSKKLHKHNEF